MINIGQRFRHFKTNAIYVVTGLCSWEPTHEPAVIYQNELTGESWGRPLQVFLEEVAVPNDPHRKAPRFALVDDSAPATSYRLEEEIDRTTGEPCIKVYNYMAEPAAVLKGGLTATITLSYLNMSRQGHRGDDYMAGVIAGCTHYIILHGNP
jgi:hypothetical protein